MRIMYRWYQDGLQCRNVYHQCVKGRGASTASLYRIQYMTCITYAHLSGQEIFYQQLCKIQSNVYQFLTLIPGLGSRGYRMDDIAYM